MSGPRARHWNAAPAGGGGYRVTARSLRAAPGEDAPALELVEARPDGPRTGAPVLFVHGAFGGAWVWSEIFLPMFARRGRHAAALSLRGHGGSDGRALLRTARLSDYLADLRRAFAAMSEPPVVVAHSLGGLLAQMLIGREQMRGLVLLASLPPEGMFFVGPRLAATDPVIWLEAYLGSLADRRLPIATAAQQILFSEGLPRERVVRYASLMTPEAPGALLDAHAPGPVPSALLYRLPTLVLGGSLDRLVWRASTLRTAFYHAGEHGSVDGVGHFMQLDVGAPEVARRVLNWLDDRRL